MLALALALGCTTPSGPDKDAAAAPAPAISYGTAMADVARRFELLGRAAEARRFELARYELDEIVEQFEDTLPRATPPHEGHPEVLPAQARAFVAGLPELRRALDARDRAAITAAFAHMATACNACHQASGHGFLEVPLEAGRSIPSTAPAPP